MTGGRPQGRPSKGERVSLLLRVDPAVMEAVRGLAEQDMRSVNAEVEFLLRDALRRRGVKLRPAGGQEDRDG